MMSIPYNYIAGTGGIGTGRFFILEGDATLGRSESRLARLTDYRDYCKLHITFHYIALFLQGIIPVYAIGRVGKDEEGIALKAEMEQAGIDTGHVTEDDSAPTMYSICGQYPNGEGFNITAGNSASNTVAPEDIDRFFAEIEPGSKGIILALPEVPVETRIYLLKKGRENQCLTIANVASAEVPAFKKLGGAVLTDIIALNLDEAGAFADLIEKDNALQEDIIKKCETYLLSLNPDITIIITLGGDGASILHRGRCYKRKAFRVPVVNTAGAGDCFLGTFVSALVHNTDPFSALDLAAGASAKKVGCKDTIDFSMSLENLQAFIREHKV